MQRMFTYRGKVVTEKDIGFINELIKANPDMSRRSLSRELCRQWNWVQPNGALRDMVCRSLMLGVLSAGLRKQKKFHGSWRRLCLEDQFRGWSIFGYHSTR